MRFTIKWRFLLKICLLVLVAGAVIHFTHRWQVRRQAGAFLRQADVARDNADRELKIGNRERAAAEREREESYLKRYLIARPDDLDARERLGRIMCQTAKNGKQLMEAFYVLDDILRRDPSRDDLRRFTVDFVMDKRLPLYKEAREHLTVLIDKQKPPKTDEAEKILGDLLGQCARCYIHEKNFAAAAEGFRESFGFQPDLLVSYYGRAVALRQLKNDVEANGSIGEMLAANLRREDPQFQPWLVATKYAREFGVPHLNVPIKGKAETFTPDQCFAQARKLAPNELEVLIISADAARVRGRELARDKRVFKALAATAETRMLLTRAIELHPLSPGGYLAMAAYEAESENLPEAIALVRKGLVATPDSLELSRGLLEYQVRSGDVAGATETFELLRKRGLPQHLGDFEHARILTLKEQWQTAAPILERVIPEFQDRPSVARQAGLLLARCYEQMGENERRLSVCNRVISGPPPLQVADQFWVPAMLGIAESQAALGQTGEALKTYRRITDWYPGAWITLARLELLVALQKTEDSKRDWTPVEEALKSAEAAAKAKYIPQDTDVRLLRASLFSYRGKAAEAEQLLNQLIAERPKEVDVRIELAMHYARANNPEQAKLPDKTLDDAREVIGDSAELRVARAKLWAGKKVDDLPGKIFGLALGMEGFNPQQQRHLLRGLAEIATAAGAKDVADKLWEKLAVAKPFDLSVHLARFDRAVSAGDLAAMQQILGKIADIDGDSGQVYRFARAIALIQQARIKNDRAPRDEALTLLEGLEQERGGRSLAGRIALAQAHILDLNGNSEGALTKYRQANDLGETNPQALLRLFQLLSEKGNSQAAQSVYEKLPVSIAAKPEIQRLAALMWLGVNQSEKAIESATKAVTVNSANYKDLIWLGKVYWTAGKHEKPEAIFRKATEVQPDAAEAWLVLIQYLIETKQPEEAARALVQAKAKVQKKDLAIFLASGHAQLGHFDLALEAYKQARVENPNDPSTLLSEAEYLLQRGLLEEARKGFKRVIELQTSSPEIRSHAQYRLALATAADPDYQKSRSAIELLPGLDSTSGKDAPAQQRSRAVVLALQKDRASKLEAIDLLEKNADGRMPEEQFILAQLYNKIGNQPKVRVVMADLLKTEQNHNPLFVGFFANWLIRGGDTQEAETWVKILTRKDPDSFRTAELKARLAMAKKDPASARAALIPKAELPDAPIGVIARICEDIGLYDDAERLLKRFVDQNKEAQPELALILPSYLGRRGRTAEALQQCEDLRAKLAAPAVGDVTVNILYNAPSPTKDEITKVVTWLEDAMGKSQGKDRALILQQLASLRNLLGEFKVASSLYQQALAANPRDVLAMNNLAYLLSTDDKKHDEALQLIERAKKSIGPDPNLLDTEALIWLNKGDPERAIKLLEEVVAEAPTGPAFFHLAQAEDAAQDRLETKKWWRQANELGLRIGDLHPLERPAYKAMSDKLK